MVQTVHPRALAVLIVTALVHLASASLINDHAKFSFSLPPLSRTSTHVYTARFEPHIGVQPPLLDGAVLTLRVVRRNPLAANVQLHSPKLNATVPGWLSGRLLWGTTVAVIEASFKNHGVHIRLFMHGALSYGFKGLGRASHLVSHPPGVRLVRSRTTVAAGVAALQAALRSNPNGPALIATIDHAAAARKIGLPLADSTVVVFGRPQIGAPLWGAQPEIGIELPLEVAIVQSPLGFVYVAYNALGALEKRFGVNTPAPVRVAVANFARIAAGLDKLAPERDGFDVGRVRFLEGIVVRRRVGTTANAAYQRLLAALERAPPINVAYAIEHDKSAKRAGITVASENKVAVFGNPSIGTRLMQESFTAALDLPVKMGVWNKRLDADDVYVGYVSADWIARRHSVNYKPDKLSAALSQFASTALGS